MADTPVWVQLALPALTAICAGLATQVAVRIKDKKAEAREQEARRSAERLGLLDPLARAAATLAWKFKTIQVKVQEGSEGSGGVHWMRQQFHLVKHPEGSAKEFGYWCNSEGFFAVSTVYATAVYFANSTRVRREYLAEQRLVRLLDAVSDSFASGVGIHHLIQDSVGQCVAASGPGELTYRQFCERIYHEDERLWFLGVLDYYREIDKRPLHERAAVCEALSALISYLTKTARTDTRNPFTGDALN